MKIFIFLIQHFHFFMKILSFSSSTGAHCFCSSEADIKQKVQIHALFFLAFSDLIQNSSRIALSPHMAKSTLYVNTFSLQLFAFFIFSSLLSIFHIFFPQLFSNTKLVLTRCICTFYFEIKTILIVKAPVCFQTLVDGPQRLK